MDFHAIVAQSKQAAPASLTSIPNELFLDIFDKFDNIDDLKNFTFAQRRPHSVFTNYKTSAVGTVVKNDIPEELYVYAVVNEVVGGSHGALPGFDDLDSAKVDSHMKHTRNLRDNADSFQPSPAAGARMSHTHKRVEELATLLTKDCAEAKNQHFAPLVDSFKERPLGPSEFVRARRAIYLFEIIRSLCRNLSFRDTGDRDYLSACYEKVGLIQKSLTTHLMAPWEMYQVIGVQAFFRRAFYGFETDDEQFEPLMQGVLASGVDFIAETLCHVPRSDLESAMAPHEKRILSEELNAFSMVISRGTRDTWTRQSSQEFNEYLPFDEFSKSSYKAWVILESEQMKFIGSSPLYAELFDSDLADLEGRLDVWSAGLWSEDRFVDICASVSGTVPDYWLKMQRHGNPTSSMIQVLMDRAMDNI